MAQVDVRATIPGSVSVIHVADGSAVDAGETILEIECMKTLWNIVAPAAGIVRLQVGPGEIVAQDQIVATVGTPG